MDQALDDLLAIFDGQAKPGGHDGNPAQTLPGPKPAAAHCRPPCRWARDPPDTLRGGARVKVLTALLQRGWIEPADDGHVLTDAGYAAIGQQRPMPPDDVQPMDTTDDLQLLEGIPVRPGTKLAALVMALRRPQGDQPATDAGHRLAAAHRARGDFRDAAQEARPERGAGAQRQPANDCTGWVIGRQGCPVSGGPADTLACLTPDRAVPRNFLRGARLRKVTTTCVRCVRRGAKIFGPISATQPANRLQTRTSIEFSSLAVFRLAWANLQTWYAPRFALPAFPTIPHTPALTRHSARLPTPWVRTANPANLVFWSDGGAMPRSRPRIGISPGREFRWLGRWGPRKRELIHESEVSI